MKFINNTPGPQSIEKVFTKAFDDTYLNMLSDEIVGNDNCMSLQLL
jgi:hypothetical protein